MDRILITGGSGYIARSLHKALKDDHDVTLISRRDLDLTDGNSVAQYMRNRYFDLVIHCAISGGSRLKEDDPKVLDENLLMYYNLYNNRSSFDRLVSFGSGAELGNPTDPYGLSKHVIRQSVLSTPGFYNIRIFGVFDENELDTRFIKANIRRYVNREPLVVHRDKFMDYYYMPDLIHLIRYYIKGEDLMKEFNCGYSTVYSLNRIASLINDLDDHSVPIITQESGFGPHYYQTGQPAVLPYKLYLHLGSVKGLEAGVREVYKKIKNG